MKTKPARELKAAFEGDDPGFEDVTPGKSLVDLGVRHRKGFVGKEILNDHALSVPGEALEAKHGVDRGAEVPIDVDLFAGKSLFVLTEVIFDRREIDWQISIEDVPIHEDAHPLFEFLVVLIDDAGFVEVFLLGVVDLAVVLACGEFFYDRFKVLLVHSDSMKRSKRTAES